MQMECLGPAVIKAQLLTQPRRPCATLRWIGAVIAVRSFNSTKGQLSLETIPRVFQQGMSSHYIVRKSRLPLRSSLSLLARAGLLET